MFRVTFIQDFNDKPLRHTTWFHDDEEEAAKDYAQYHEEEGATEVKVEQVLNWTSVAFAGTLGGDGECFCWSDVSGVEDVADIDEYSHKGRLYPDSVFRRLGCKKKKMYKFTISVEEI